jgi:hypothetical protein
MSALSSLKLLRLINYCCILNISRWENCMGKRLLMIFLIALSLLAAAWIRAAEDEKQSLGDTVRELNQLKVKNWSDTTVPPKARPLLTVLKHQLRDLIHKTLDANGTDIASLNKVHADLVSELEKQNIRGERYDIVRTSDDKEPGFTYGRISSISIEKIKDSPDILAATTTIPVCCGSDTSLYLFKKNGRKWDLILAQESNDYAEVSGAQGSFQFEISPAAGGNFFVVTKNVNPWCSSNWQAIRYKAMKPGPTAYQPKILLEKEASIYLGNLTGGFISLEPGKFTIRYDAGQRLDDGVLIRRHVDAYKVEGDRVSRIAPLAEEPEGFLDEWCQLPWAEASKWIAGPVTTSLQKWHKKIHDDLNSNDLPYITGFSYVPPACSFKAGEWQIGLFFEPIEGKSLPKGTPSEIFFNVIENKSHEYFIQSSSLKALPKCERN